jgi:hypothetical protein
LLFPIIVQNPEQVAGAVGRLCVGSRTVFFREHLLLLKYLGGARTSPVFCQPWRLLVVWSNPDLMYYLNYAQIHGSRRSRLPNQAAGGHPNGDALKARRS